MTEEERRKSDYAEWEGRFFHRLRYPSGEIDMQELREAFDDAWVMGAQWAEHPARGPGL